MHIKLGTIIIVFPCRSDHCTISESHNLVYKLTLRMLPTEKQVPTRSTLACDSNTSRRDVAGMELSCCNALQPLKTTAYALIKRAKNTTGPSSNSPVLPTSLHTHTQAFLYIGTPGNSSQLSHFTASIKENQRPHLAGKGQWQQVK